MGLCTAVQVGYLNHNITEDILLYGKEGQLTWRVSCLITLGVTIHRYCEGSLKNLFTLMAFVCERNDLLF